MYIASVYFVCSHLLRPFRMLLLLSLHFCGKEDARQDGRDVFPHCHSIIGFYRLRVVRRMSVSS